ncbi:DUF5701 family protein [Streptomyces gulbargensis]|uniref:DUF5701 family protein n=1 Tax=Streptomyces gulbargensis TaxID=364901 RepID=UPI003CD09383
MPAVRRDRDPHPPSRRSCGVRCEGGTGRDGRERRDAPGVGRRRAGDRHTWPGFAATTPRSGRPGGVRTGQTSPPAGGPPSERSSSKRTR